MIILTDFDGTITREDVIDEILERFADKEWLQIEAEWQKGSIGSLECLRRQMSLVKAGASELESLLDSITIDPSFISFLRFCFTEEIPLRILSDNFRWFIQHILRKSLPGEEALLRQVPVFSNEVEIMGTRLEFNFPYSGSANGCDHGCATCKASVIRKARLKGEKEIIFIGDGLSDRFGAKEADLVFGKGKLLEYCHAEGIEVIPFEHFSKVQDWVEKRRKVLDFYDTDKNFA